MHPLLSLTALRDLNLVFPSYFDIACMAVDLHRGTGLSRSRDLPSTYLAL